MLYFIAVWVGLTVVCTIIGTDLLTGLKANHLDRVGDRALAALWVGVIVLAIALLATSLFVPLSPLVGILIAGALALPALLSQNTRRELRPLQTLLPRPDWLKLLILGLGIAALMARPVSWIDAGIYHYGAIRWLGNFGAVPGLALLANQFGFTSAWFALAAPFNPEVFQGRASSIMNGFALWLTVLHIWVSGRQGFTTQARPSDWFALVSFFLILPPMVATNLLSAVLVSPSPDIPVIFLTVAIAWAILAVTQTGSSQPIPAGEPGAISHPPGTLDLIPLILAVGAVTIKLTALPLLAVTALFYGVRQRVHLRRLLVGGGVTILLLLPILLLNGLISGCLLYPSGALCFDFPWSQTAQEAQAIAELTRGWSTWFTDPGKAASVGWLVWQWLTTIPSSRFIVALMVLSGLGLIYVVRMMRSLGQWGSLWVLLLAIAGTGFMLLQAPLLRFGMGYVILLPALAIALWLHSKGQVYLQQIRDPGQASHWLRRGFPYFAGAILAVAVGHQALNSRLFLPPPLPSVQVTPQQINDVLYFMPQNKQGLCWASPLPCAAKPDPQIRLRAPSRGLRAGFARRS